jgi:predicted amidohydrolase YtcJ
VVGAEPHAWLGGRVFTGHRWVEAVLAENGRIIAAGSDAEVRRQASTGTSVTALEGRAAIPGLVDAHMHWLTSVVASVGPRLADCRSVASLQDRVREALRRDDIGPVVGWGWDQERFDLPRYPTRRDLDAVRTDRPVVLYRVCEHVAVLNGPALDELGIDRTTADPPGGRIGRDADGTPNGLLFDRGLRGLRRFSVAIFDKRGTAATAVLASAARSGLTTLGAMSVGPEEIDRARTDSLRTPLPVRLRFYLLAQYVPLLPRFDGMRRTDDLRLTGLKLALDGALGPRTAWLSAPYADHPEERGIEVATEEEATAAAQTAQASGLGVAFHAIGDRALHRALDVFERIPLDGRARIEHASIVPPSALERLKRVRPNLVVQPRFVESDRWIGDRLGPLRVAWAYPFRALLDLGLVVAGSSDAPIEPLDPWTGLRAARTLRGLSVEESLHLYTVAGGAALGEPELGHLEPGSRADLVILRSPDPARALELVQPVASTWRAGEEVATGTPRPEGAI